jgi:FHS family L-fucose permease-like MFS transporter
MFPTIYGIALEGVQQDSKFGAAGLIMSIVGGSVLTPVQAAIMDTGSNGSMIHASFVVPLVCFVVIAGYGVLTYRKKI